MLYTRSARRLTSTPSTTPRYTGTVKAVYASGSAKIAYDDGDAYVWPADFAARAIYTLPPGHPAFGEKTPGGAPTQDGLPATVEVTQLDPVF